MPIACIIQLYWIKSFCEDLKILNCVNIEYLCTQKHGLSIMLFGCHKKKTVVPPKNCWQLLTSIITIIIPNDRNDGNINDIYFHVGKTAEISKWRKWFFYFYSAFNLTLPKRKTGHPSTNTWKMNRFCRNKYTFSNIILLTAF